MRNASKYRIVILIMGCLGIFLIGSIARKAVVVSEENTYIPIETGSLYDSAWVQLTVNQAEEK